MGTKLPSQSYEPADIADLSELAEQARMLRAALERVRNELAVAAAAEEALVSKLRELGVSVEGVGPRGSGGSAAGDTLAGAFGLGEETTKTEIDTFGIRGLPKSRRGGRSSAALGGASTSQQGMLKAAAAGAGLMLGLAVFVLLVINLASSKKDASLGANAANATASAPPSLSGPTTPPRPLDESRQIPPPPAPNADPPTTTVSSAAPAIVSAVVPAARPATNGPEGVATLTVVCTPRCDSVTSDNNSLGGSPTNVPIAPGTHKLTLSSPNGVKKTLMVNINQGQAREVRVSMEQGSPHDYGF